jgi:malate dehydrogenase (oxaloacetate-decarboxylating)
MDRDELIALANKPARDALLLHPFYRGKVQMAPKVPIRGSGDFAIWYTPGVAASSRAIQSQPELVWEHTNRANLVAVVSDGTRVLGLGDIGPEAGLPVMEGKALLFKLLGGVDAVPLCLRTKDPDELIRAVELLEPSFGAINLEDIAQPKCFRVLELLRQRLRIPVWHDDQQGTATVLTAALLSALRVVGKELASIRIAMIGMGAANVATYRLLTQIGVDRSAIVACDSAGTLHRGRHDLEAKRHEFENKWRVCEETNADGIVGGIPEALRGADVCIAFSMPGPNVIHPEWVRAMRKDAIVFACANPVPEIWPWEAKEANARVVCTGRSDFPNQVNNSLGFPAIFRGALDVRASTISDGMALAAARELATFAASRGLREDDVMPRMEEWEVFPRVAAATGVAACAEGLARVPRSREELSAAAMERITAARELLAVLTREGLIPPVPRQLSPVAV